MFIKQAYDDGAEWKCLQCGKLFPPAQAYHIESADGSRKTWCKFCLERDIDDDISIEDLIRNYNTLASKHNG